MAISDGDKKYLDNLLNIIVDLALRTFINFIFFCVAYQVWLQGHKNKAIFLVALCVARRRNSIGYFGSEQHEENTKT